MTAECHVDIATLHRMHLSNHRFTCCCCKRFTIIGTTGSIQVVYCKQAPLFRCVYEQRAVFVSLALRNEIVYVASSVANLTRSGTKTYKIMHEFQMRLILSCCNPANNLRVYSVRNSTPLIDSTG